MNDTPEIGEYLDEEERELIEAIESDDYEAGESGLTPQKIEALQEAARNTIHRASTKVSIRIPRTDLSRVKSLALQEGIPYQTLIKSIIHKAVNR